MMRQAGINQSSRFFHDLGRERDQSTTFHFTQPPPPPTPRKPSKFDGPDVIDLVRGADGAWHVPAALEPKVRKL